MCWGDLAGPNLVEQPSCAVNRNRAMSILRTWPCCGKGLDNVRSRPLLYLLRLLRQGFANALVRSWFCALARCIGLARSSRNLARIADRTFAVSAHLFRFIERLDALHAGVWRATDRAVPIITALDQHPSALAERPESHRVLLLDECAGLVLGGGAVLCVARRSHRTGYRANPDAVAGPIAVIRTDIPAWGR